MVKINSKTIKEFLEKSTLKGQIPQAVIEFTENNVVMKLKTQQQTNAVESHLTKESFSEYDISELLKAKITTAENGSPFIWEEKGEEILSPKQQKS